MSGPAAGPADRPVHPVWEFLDRPITLVSTSPRRAAILRNLGVPFETVEPAWSDEGSPSEERLREEGGVPARLAVSLAKRKVLSVARPEGKRILLGADTVVVVDGAVLGKPGDPGEAVDMLGRLSGRTHRVTTGIFLRDERTGRSEESAEETRVVFRELRPGEVRRYVESGEPFDKAGAYGIQGLAGLFVSGIEGCYFNVVGLPVHNLGEALRRLCGGAGNALS